MSTQHTTTKEHTMTTTTNLEARREAVRSIAAAMRQARSTVYGAWLDDDRLLDFWYEAHETGAISTEPPTEELWFGRHAEHDRNLDTAEFDDLLNEALEASWEDA